jgi:PilZ domain-containing protein
MKHFRTRQGIDMLANRRRSERRLCRRVAKIQFGTSSLPRDCVITDMSDGGVKVIAEYLDIPSEFTIILSTGHPRQCRLAWRIGCELGAQFID